MVAWSANEKANYHSSGPQWALPTLDALYRKQPPTFSEGTAYAKAIAAKGAAIGELNAGKWAGLQEQESGRIKAPQKPFGFGIGGAPSLIRQT